MIEVAIDDPARVRVVLSQRLPLCGERAQMFLHAHDAIVSLLRFGSREHVMLELARDLAMD